jgi:hypothetical protein
VLLSSKGEGRRESYLVSHAPECIIFPWKVSIPGILGHFTSFSWPRAVTRTLAVSSMVSPVWRFWTFIFLFLLSVSWTSKNRRKRETHQSLATSSHSQCFTSWLVLMNRVAPNLVATSSRYFWISLPGAYRFDQLGLGANEYWYECAVDLLVLL